ncbi:MAG: hypothetical protein LBG87_04420 [Spirochaetaceae bacterium]|jgi:hypothetical protein|nr:hypothetical protein [Spirochaetaceae bacterium]
MKRVLSFLNKYRLIGCLLCASMLAGCFRLEPEAEPEKQTGLVEVRIPLSADEPYRTAAVKEDIEYFEAVFRDQGNYYIGRAFTGSSYLVVSVPPGRYDILVLAGVSVTGNDNGVKVLLASGYRPECIIKYGQRQEIPVTMTMHQTSEGMFQYKPGIATYTQEINGLGALISSTQSVFDPGTHLSNPHAYLVPIPDPWAEESVFAVPAIDSPSPTRLRIETELDQTKIANTTDYKLYYTMTYYAFGDSASGSSPWDIRQSVTPELENQPYGGAALVADNRYYVSANGRDDIGDGSFSNPFKTITHAVTMMQNPPNPLPHPIRTIVVVGTLDEHSERNDGDGITFGLANNIFYINITTAVGLISITGYENPSDPAILKTDRDTRVLALSGANTRIRFDNIEITGAKRSGIWIGNGAELILGEGVKIHNNRATSSGGGIHINVDGKLTMNTGAEISGNTVTGTGYGGGVNVSGGAFTMNGGFIKNNIGVNGGGVSVLSGSFTMSGGTIQGNSSTLGGGLYIKGGTAAMSGGAIEENQGGGVNVQTASFTMSGHALVTGNQAPVHHGMIVKAPGTFTMKDSAAVDYTCAYPNCVALQNGAKISIAGNLTPSLNVEAARRSLLPAYTANILANTGAVALDGSVAGNNAKFLVNDTPNRIGAAGVILP